jgi:hypothetical protein
MKSKTPKPKRKKQVAIVGGGAAGIFAAIACAEHHDNVDVTIFEAGKQPLQKVSLSGGGRCNLTHHCFDPEELVKSYPRGGRELIGAFKRFQPRDTVAWFARHGVRLKTEDDGRVFPVTDQAATVVECLLANAAAAEIVLIRDAPVAAIRHTPERKAPRFDLELKRGQVRQFDKVLLASGSGPQGYLIAAALGHTIVPCVPSLFSFKVKDERLRHLPGVSLPNAHLILSTGDRKRLEQTGPLLITHSGLSGPAVLKLSAWGARLLADHRYQAELIINWVPPHNAGSLLSAFHAYREEHPKRTVMAGHPPTISSRLWERIVRICGVDQTTTWAHLTKEAMARIAGELTNGSFKIVGKGEFKDEFVTCGGVKLKEVDFRTMESRICPGLYFAGEILDIDGLTGGYNLQNAWTTGWIAGESL